MSEPEGDERDARTGLRILRFVRLLEEGKIPRSDKLHVLAEFISVEKGAHVIVPTRGREVPDSVVERAAEVAAWHSSARDAGQVEVDVAQRRYVKKIPEAPPGLVRYSNERTVRVTPKS